MIFLLAAFFRATIHVHVAASLALEPMKKRLISSLVWAVPTDTVSRYIIIYILNLVYIILELLASISSNEFYLILV